MLPHLCSLGLSVQHTYLMQQPSPSHRTSAPPPSRESPASFLSEPKRPQSSDVPLLVPCIHMPTPRLGSVTCHHSSSLVLCPPLPLFLRGLSTATRHLHAAARCPAPHISDPTAPGAAGSPVALARPSSVRRPCAPPPAAAAFSGTGNTCLGDTTYVVVASCMSSPSTALLSPCSVNSVIVFFSIPAVMARCGTPEALLSPPHGQYPAARSLTAQRENG